MAVTLFHIAQSVRAVGGKHMGNGAHGGVLGNLGVFIAQLIAELEQGLRRLAGAYIAACLQVGKTLDEGQVHLALLLLLAPALGVLGQHEQCREGAQCRIADGKRGQQRQQQHVQRDIDAVG